MRILIIADPHIPVPPLKYGGTERIVAMQARALVAAGHEVRLMAGAGSIDFGGGLVAHRKPSLEYCSRAWRKILFQRLLMEAMQGVDAIINHGRTDYLPTAFIQNVPLVLWFHNPVHQREVDYLNRHRHNKRCLVFVSANQRAHLDDLGEECVVPNAVDTSLYSLSREPAVPGYVAFLGRMTENKGVDMAIAAARDAKMRLKIAGNISDEPGAKRYFETRVKPSLGDGCEWLGEVDDQQKRLLLQGATALLFPIRWKEPFGLVTLESLACGTPVVSSYRAAMPEILVNGETGFLCRDIGEMTAALLRIRTIDRVRCRQEVETRFSPDNLLKGTLTALDQAGMGTKTRSKRRGGQGRQRIPAKTLLVVTDARLSVPPRHYGGTERMAANFCTGLRDRGYAVRLLAKTGSRNFGGRLVTHIGPTLRYRSRVWRKLLFQWLVFRSSLSCDAVVNFGRTDYLPALFRRRIPLVLRFGNPVRQEEIDFINRRRKGNRTFVFISQSQRQGLRGADPSTIVYNGVDTEFYRAGLAPLVNRSYAAFIGRLTEKKGILTAIETAQAAGIPLKIAGNISDDPHEANFFESVIRPRLGNGCDWVGTIDDDGKQRLLRGARALLFPIQWPEPFGIVMAESLACGTPVVALANGAVPEVIRHGVTGFVCKDAAELPSALRAATSLSIADCRREAESRFSLEQFVDGMLAAVDRAAPVDSDEEL